MSHADVYRVVSEFVPTTHMEWPNDSMPDLPMACYYGSDNSISADDFQIAVRHRWTVELYEKRRDAQLETNLANALREEFGQINREETCSNCGLRAHSDLNASRNLQGLGYLLIAQGLQ